MGEYQAIFDLPPGVYQMASFQTAENVTQCKTCRCGEGDTNIWTARTSDSSDKQSSSCPSCQVEYDFEYYKLEMAADVQLLVLSEGKSNILPTDLVLPFRPTAVSAVNVGTEELQSWRWYLATVRSLPSSSELEINKMLENEMVDAMREDRSLGSTDLNRLLTMVQLMSTSFGEKTLSLEHWRMVKSN